VVCKAFSVFQKDVLPPSSGQKSAKYGKRQCTRGEKYIDHGVIGTVSKNPGLRRSGRGPHKQMRKVGHKNCNYSKIRKRVFTDINIKLAI
jgi:hypothetical protein